MTFNSAYKSHIIITVSNLHRWDNELVTDLKKLPITLFKLEDDKMGKINFYKNNFDDWGNYDPFDNFEKAIELALVGALAS